MVATSDYRGHLYDDMDSAGLSGGKSIYEPEEKEAEEMSDYPNVDAFIQGSCWKLTDVHIEVAAMQKQLAEQGKGLQECNEEILDKSRRNIALKDEVDQLRRKLSGLCQPIAITDEMVKQSQAELKRSQTRNEALKGECIHYRVDRNRLQVKFEQLEEKKNEHIASLTKALAGTSYPCQLGRLQEQARQLQAELTLVMGCNQTQEEKIRELKQFLNNQASTIAKLRLNVRIAQADGNKAMRCWVYTGEDGTTKEMMKDINFLRAANEQLEEERKTMVATRDEVIANKDKEIKELKRRNANQVFNCRSLREGKNRLREEIKQLSAELVETQKDVSFLCVKELREKIKQLRRQRDCLHKYFGIGLYVKMPDDLVEVLFEIDEEDKDGTPAS